MAIGSKVLVRKQDPSVEAIGVRASYIPSRVRRGPRDEAIRVMGMPDVHPNAQRDFLFSPSENPLEFDAVHTFTVVRQVLSMYQRVFRSIGLDGNARWQWGDSPLDIHPRAGIDANAYYSRGERTLRFFYFVPQSGAGSQVVFTCRSFDIVAHETGHAILDALRPGYWGSGHPQTGGLHESFGDLTAIFTMLAQMDQCEAIIAESKADLHAKSFFSAVGEQFGEALDGRTTGLRNADNDLKLSEVGTQVHQLSQVFTGAVYDILADIFEDYSDRRRFDPAESLFRVGKHLTALVVLSLARGPAANASYGDIARAMIEIEPRKRWKPIIERRFEEREIFASNLSAAENKPGQANWSLCCGTLAGEEHVSAVETA